MARKKKEVIETNEIKENEVTNTNTNDIKIDDEQQNPTKTNEDEQQKVTIKGVVISKGGLRVREEQSLDSNIIDVLPYNSEIEILEIFEEWVQVENGFMLKKFIEINE